jgi:hypothetical protein
LSILKGEVDVQNPYLPYPVRIEEIITETEDKNLKTGLVTGGESDRVIDALKSFGLSDR